MKTYQAWIVARHPVTLEIVATLLVYENNDRTRVEAVIENAQTDFKSEFDAIKRIMWQHSPIISTELKITDMRAQFEVWAAKEWFGVVRLTESKRHPGLYDTLRTQIAYSAWQAANGR